jgi:hypothetical protein
MNNMQKIDKDWDIIFFGMCWEICNKVKKIDKKNLYKLYSPKCRHAYGLSRKGAEKILKYTVPMVNNGDIMYAENIKQNKMQAYGIYKPIFYQNRNEYGSNLGNNIGIARKILIRINKNLFKKKKIIYPPVCSPISFI